MPKGLRRQAREIALQTLYEADSVQHDPLEVLGRHFTEEKVPVKAQEYAQKLVEGIKSRTEEIDKNIQFAAVEWPLHQMAKIDKSILRLAIYELLFDNAVPAKAAINEAVELAKIYGSDTSSRFVNGVLGTVYKHSYNETEKLPTTSAESEVR